MYWQIKILQIYVEVERARLTHILAQMKEKDGEVTEAANIMQELQVETYGSMERREKVFPLCFLCNVVSFFFLVVGWTYSRANETLSCQKRLYQNSDHCKEDQCKVLWREGHTWPEAQILQVTFASNPKNLAVF